MPNRRDFFKTVAGATAGAYVTGRSVGHALGQAPAAAKRREVSIAGRRIKVVDVHCHCVVPEVAEVVKGTPLAIDQTGVPPPNGLSALLTITNCSYIIVQGLELRNYETADEAVTAKEFLAHARAINQPDVRASR